MIIGAIKATLRTRTQLDFEQMQHLPTEPEHESKTSFILGPHRADKTL